MGLFSEIACYSRVPYKGCFPSSGAAWIVIEIRVDRVEGSVHVRSLSASRVRAAHLRVRYASWRPSRAERAVALAVEDVERWLISKRGASMKPGFNENSRLKVNSRLNFLGQIR